MHVLMLTQYYAPEIGAPQTRLRSTVAEIVRAGHQVTVLTAMPNHLHDGVFPGYEGKKFMEEQVDGVRVLRSWIYAAMGRSWKRLGNYFSFVASSALVKGKVEDVDLVFCESPPLFLGLTAAYMAKRYKAKLVMNVSDLWPDSVRAVAPGTVFAEGPLYKAAERLEAWLYKRSDSVTAVTPGIYDSLLGEKGLAPEKVSYLPNGIDPDMFRPAAADQRSQPKQFLFAGTLGFAQGLEIALEAAEVLRHRTDIEFKFLGAGPVKAEIAAASADRGLTNMTFHDPVPLESMPGHFAACTAAVVTLSPDPFFDQGRPSRTFPPLACARPVIFAGRSEICDILNDNTCGQAIEPGDGEQLAAAIARYADDLDLADAHGRNGERYVNENLTWKSLVGRWLEQIEL
jgi:colanic acid biosynthesis glycosyl transferase WcaI